MLTSRFGVLERNFNWNQHVHLLQAGRALLPDEPEMFPPGPSGCTGTPGTARPGSSGSRPDPDRPPAGRRRAGAVQETVMRGIAARADVGDSIAGGISWVVVAISVPQGTRRRGMPVPRRRSIRECPE